MVVGMVVRGEPKAVLVGVLMVNGEITVWYQCKVAGLIRSASGVGDMVGE